MTEQPNLFNWREWDEEAFAQARAQDKPVLLDIGAVWCHWCHVMDHGIAGDPVHTGTYSDPDVQQRIADGFIPIKVDNDKRPDINARYNMGGWPTTAFLTPDGDILYGETYVPPPRMIALLDHITELWQTRREDVIAQTREMRDTPAEAAPPAASALDPATVPHVIVALHKAHDTVYGGFGAQPKFPHPAALRLALEQGARTGDAALRRLVVSTLRGMAGGGMYDEYAGGFFRYSTTRDWSVPHYEKMLEDNALLTALYIQAAQVLEMPEFLDAACSAQDWLLTTMRDPATGAFAGSQDADAEDAYYGQPLNVRATLPTPYIDRTIYAGWNALTVSALTARYQATGEQTVLDSARQAFTFLDTLRADVQTDVSGQTHFALYHYFADGKPQGTIGLLDDHTAYLTACLDLHEATGQADTKKRAVATAAYILAMLEDPQNGGFYDAPPDPQAIGALARPKVDMSANADAALALLRLSALTGGTRYSQAGERALHKFVQEYAQMSYFASAYARAVDAYTRPVLHIVLTGTAGDQRLREMQQTAWSLPIPGKAVETPAAADAAERGFPSAEDSTPRAYVCLGTACQIATEARELWTQCGLQPPPGVSL